MIKGKVVEGLRGDTALNASFSAHSFSCIQLPDRALGYGQPRSWNKGF